MRFLEEVGGSREGRRTRLGPLVLCCVVLCRVVFTGALLWSIGRVKGGQVGVGQGSLRPEK